MKYVKYGVKITPVMISWISHHKFLTQWHVSQNGTLYRTAPVSDVDDDHDSDDHDWRRTPRPGPRRRPAPPAAVALAAWHRLAARAPGPAAPARQLLSAT